MSTEELELLASAVATSMKEAIDPLVTRIAALNGALKMTGVYIKGQQYHEAALVTRGGGLWVATAQTTSTPGTPEWGWRLRGEAG